MGMSERPIIAIVTRDTRIAGLKARWATARQALFRMRTAQDREVELRRHKMAQAGMTVQADQETAIADAAGALAEFEEYEEEDQTYQAALQQVRRNIDFGFPIKTVDRTFLPNFDFRRCLAVVVVGPDGLVANTAKYADNLPIIGVNPDPARIDGVLLPFRVSEVRSCVRRTIDDRAKIMEVTLAEVTTNDGQTMLAFNDFYVGARTHVSARYTLEAPAGTEAQSSSGIVVATGAGSTGWLSSIINGAQGLSQFFQVPPPPPFSMERDERRLAWVVREPFKSRYSYANRVAGWLNEDDELVVGSQMPEDGVIFSDGIEADYLEFTSGTIARFRVADQRARLVVK